MSEYPLPVNHFQVDWGGSRIGFTEVSGLSIEVQVAEYREGSDPEYKPRKMPVSFKYSNIVLKRGIVARDNEFFDWLNTIKLNKVERRDLVISLLNEEHAPVMVWKVKNAFPVKLEGPVLMADSDDVAIETLEVAHEGITVESAD
mgnify:CR=1 FL=1